MTAPNETSKDTTAYGHRRRHFGNYGTGTRIPKIRLHKLHLDYLNIAWTLIWKEKKKLAENPTLLLSIRTLAWLIQSMDNPRKKKQKKKKSKRRNTTECSVIHFCRFISLVSSSFYCLVENDSISRNGVPVDVDIKVLSVSLIAQGYKMFSLLSFG